MCKARRSRSNMEENLLVRLRETALACYAAVWIGADCWRLITEVTKGAKAARPTPRQNGACVCKARQTGGAEGPQEAAKRGCLWLTDGSCIRCGHSIATTCGPMTLSKTTPTTGERIACSTSSTSSHTRCAPTLSPASRPGLTNIRLGGVDQGDPLGGEVDPWTVNPDIHTITARLNFKFN